MNVAADDDERPEFDLVTEWHASPSLVAAFFLMNDWKWDCQGQLRSPTGLEVVDLIDDMMEELEEGPGGMYLTCGRFKVYKDPEFPESYEIYMQVGHASPRVPEGSP